MDTAAISYEARPMLGLPGVISGKVTIYFWAEGLDSNALRTRAPVQRHVLHSNSGGTPCGQLLELIGASDECAWSVALKCHLYSASRRAVAVQSLPPVR